jgi:hypothetical protein
MHIRHDKGPSSDFLPTWKKSKAARENPVRFGEIRDLFKK